MRLPTARVSAQTAATFAELCSYHLTECGACDQTQLATFRDCRAIAEHSISLALDCIQNFLTSAAKEFNIDGKLPTDFRHKRQSPFKPIARAVNFEAHHLAELRSVLARTNIGLFDPVLR